MQRTTAPLYYYSAAYKRLLPLPNVVLLQQGGPLTIRAKQTNEEGDIKSTYLVLQQDFTTWGPSSPTKATSTTTFYTALSEGVEEGEEVSS